MTDRSRTRRGRRPRRNKSDDQVWPFVAELAINGLTDDTVSGGTCVATSDACRTYSALIAWALEGMTPGEGPIEVGLYDSDLSVTEVKEALNASPTNRSAIVEREKARRPVRNSGTFRVANAEEVLNDGRPIYTRVLMKHSQSANLNFFAYNKSGGTLAAGSVLHVSGKLFGGWI